MRDAFTWVPVYVTRENHRNYVGTFKIRAWQWFVFRNLFFLNLIVWTIVGLITAFKVVF